jgi:hypothetical protein
MPAEITHLYGRREDAIRVIARAPLVSLLSFHS